MPTFVHCQTCGDEFEGEGRFCCADCYWANKVELWRRHTESEAAKHEAAYSNRQSSIAGQRKCDWCDSPFKPKARNQYCCSSLCKAQKDKYTARRQV